MFQNAARRRRVCGLHHGNSNHSQEGRHLDCTRASFLATSHRLQPPSELRMTTPSPAQLIEQSAVLESYRSRANSSTVSPASRISARRVPLASSLWLGIDRRLCGGLACRRMMWLPCCSSNSYPSWPNALTASLPETT